MLEGLRRFVVKALQRGREPSAFQEVNAALVAGEYVGAGAGSKRFRVDLGSVIVVDFSHSRRL